jgi:hypothetical protein
MLQKIFIILYLGCFSLGMIHFLESKPLPEYINEDYSYYQAAYERLAQGEDPYSDRKIGTAYIYPPPVLLLIGAIDQIPEGWKDEALVTGNTILLILTSLMIAKYFQGNFLLCLVLCLGFGPVWVSILLGQINILVLFLCVFYFTYLEKAPLVSGFALGLAILAKVSPAILILYAISRRKHQAVLATFFSIIVSSILFGQLYGWEHYWSFKNTLQYLTTVYPLSFSIYSATCMLCYKMKWVALYWGAIAQKILSLFTFTAALTATYLAYNAKFSRKSLFALLLILMTITPNIIWYHHFSFILLPLVFLTLTKQSRPLGILLGITLQTLPMIFLPMQALLFQFISILLVIYFIQSELRRDEESLQVNFD